MDVDSTENGGQEQPCNRSQIVPGRRVRDTEEKVGIWGQQAVKRTTKAVPQAASTAGQASDTPPDAQAEHYAAVRPFICASPQRGILTSFSSFLPPPNSIITKAGSSTMQNRIAMYITYPCISYKPL